MYFHTSSILFCVNNFSAAIDVKNFKLTVSEKHVRLCTIEISCFLMTHWGGVAGASDNFSFSSKKDLTFYEKYRALKLSSSDMILTLPEKIKWVFISSTTRLITKTCLYYFDPLKPHFYIVKLGFTGVYIIFLISAQKHRLWVLIRTDSSKQF